MCKRACLLFTEFPNDRWLRFTDWNHTIRTIYQSHIILYYTCIPKQLKLVYLSRLVRSSKFHSMVIDHSDFMSRYVLYIMLRYKLYTHITHCVLILFSYSLLRKYIFCNELLWFYETKLYFKLLSCGRQ